MSGAFTPGVHEPFEIRSPGRFIGWIAIAFVALFIAPSVLYALFVGELAAGLFGCVFFAFWLSIVGRFTRIRVVASEEGLTVHNGTLRRRVPWSEVKGIHLHTSGRRARAVDVWLTNNESLTLAATTRPDALQVECFLAALQSWLPPR